MQVERNILEIVEEKKKTTMVWTCSLNDRITNTKENSKLVIRGERKRRET